MIKDIVVNLNVDGQRDPARNFAISVAAKLQAHLRGVAFSYEPIAYGTVFDDSSPAFIDAQREANEAAAKAAVAAFEEAVRGTGVLSESQILSGTAGGCGSLFGQVARVHDLAIVGQAEPDAGLAESLILEGALFASGRPVLIVPYIQTEPLKLDRVLLCWDGSQNAARAIADSLPLLQKSTSLEVITIAAKDNNRQEIPGVDIAQHLARHGLKVNLKRIVVPDVDVPNTVLSHAADTNVDLIVMGGYGHTRFREFVFGGATRGILSSMTVPTLMSH